MRHDIHDILKVIDAMHDKALLIARVQISTDPSSTDRAMIKHLMADIQAMARQIANENDSD